MRAWEDFLKAQQKEIGADTVNKWLRPLKIVHFDAGNLYLEASDPFQVLWFEEHIRPKVLSQLVNSNHRQIKVHLTVVENKAGSFEEAQKSRKERRDTPPPPPPSLFTSEALDPYATLSNFVFGEKNLFVEKFLTELIEHPFATPHNSREFCNPIYIHGKTGAGKTHLLMAIANALKQKGSAVFYVRSETFTQHVIHAIRNSAMQEFRKAYRHVQALFIDDIDLLARKSATQEELFHTFNTLHTEGKHIILSASTAPQFLTEIEERLISRFEWGITLPIEKLSLEERKLAFLNRIRFLNLTLKEDIAHFLLTTFSSTIKALFQAVDALILRAHLKEDSSSLDSLTCHDVEKILADLIQLEKQSILSSEKILQSVAHFYGIRVEDILGKSQCLECTLPRQITMYLCREKLKLPFLKIGRILSRDHSTVISSIKHIQKKIENPEEKELAFSLAEISRLLEKYI